MPAAVAARPSCNGVKNATNAFRRVRALFVVVERRILSGTWAARMGVATAELCTSATNPAQSDALGLPPDGLQGCVESHSARVSYVVSASFGSRRTLRLHQAHNAVDSRTMRMGSRALRHADLRRCNPAWEATPSLVVADLRSRGAAFRRTIHPASRTRRLTGVAQPTAPFSGRRLEQALLVLIKAGDFEWRSTPPPFFLLNG